MATLLAVSVALNVFLVVYVVHVVNASRKATYTANQRVREAERAADARIQGLIDRINTSQRVQVERKLELPALQEDKPYISDFEYDQPRWEDYVGATEEAEA